MEVLTPDVGRGVAHFTVRVPLGSRRRTDWERCEERAGAAGHRAASPTGSAPGTLPVPYEHRELMPGGHSLPLGRWLADQR